MAKKTILLTSEQMAELQSTGRTTAGLFAWQDGDKVAAETGYAKGERGEFLDVSVACVDDRLRIATVDA